MPPAVAPTVAPTAAPTGPPTAPPTTAPPTAPAAGPPCAIASVGIDSADAISAAVISVRFKLASCVEPERRTGSAVDCSAALHVFPKRKLRRLIVFHHAEPRRAAAVELHH